MDRDPCPHCGSEDFGDVGPGTPRICLACGYDDENGATGVCPGGKHPLDWDRRSRGLCCSACYDRLPRDLPGFPRWRSVRRRALAHPRAHGFTLPEVQRRVTQWLSEHQIDLSTAR